MVLAVDIGNSAIKFGLFEAGTLTSKFSIPTERDATADAIKIAVGDRLDSSLDAAVVCSVVPELESQLRIFLRDVTDSEATFVHNAFDFGLKITYEPIESLGTDRLVNAFAAVENYGAPCIVCSLGTATTIDVVSADREFLGGVIAPGMDAMAEALHLKAPRLPRVDVRRSHRLIGNTTAGSVGSGIYNGYVAMVEGLIMRLRSESAVSRVVGTGGNSELLSAAFTGMMTVDPDLLLIGLRTLAQR
jgi:type III pantothenate kinase